MKLNLKGQSLPLNTIVIAILVVIVLVVIIAFFADGMFKGGKDIENAKCSEATLKLLIPELEEVKVSDSCEAPWKTVSGVSGCCYKTTS